MVQKSTGSISILLRLICIVAAVVFARISVGPFGMLVNYLLPYKEQCHTTECALGLGVVAIGLSFAFWVGVIFSTLGKKEDYVFISVVFILIFLFSAYAGGEGVLTLLIILIAITLIGNGGGYLLRIARKRFFPTSWIRK